MYRKSVHTPEEWSREARMVKVQKCSNNKSMLGLQSHEEHHHQQVFWGQTTFECSFCKRQFRSAQALGGHMNVHRRERAKLANTHNSQITKPKSSPPFSPPATEEQVKPRLKCCHNIDNGREVRKRPHNGLDLDLNLNLNLNLDTGFIRDHHNKEDLDLDLDLELRLGFSS